MLARVVTGVGAGTAFSLAIFLPIPGLFMLVVAALLVICCKGVGAAVSFFSPRKNKLYSDSIYSLFVIDLGKSPVN